MKGIHTQGLAVLFSEPPADGALLDALAPFGAAPRPAGDTGWMGGAPGCVLPTPQGGTAVVHAFPVPWPDGMGDPKADPMLFGAWTMGFFGPYAYPGGLERAVQQAWHWEGAAETVTGHRAFVRILTTFVGGKPPDTPIRPPGYDARAELELVTRVAAAICALPGAVAFFDVAGEVVLAPEELAARLAEAEEQRRPPLDAWSNVRLFRIADVAPWTLMDTVGMGQLDRGDLEACFPADRYDPQQVARFLRNVALYLLGAGDVVKDGDTVDGPGGPWRARVAREALFLPPRATLRFFPDGAGPAPVPLQRGIGAPAHAPREPAKGFWKRLFGG